MFRQFKFTPFTKSSMHSILSIFISSISLYRFGRILSRPENKSFEWKYAIDNVNDTKLGFFLDYNRPIVTVVVLGWLGSKQEHLKRYAEMYNLLGMNAITFTASVNDVISIDLGMTLYKKVEGLSDEIVLWLEKIEIDGRQRFLIFHTFSNTGWIAYGHILNLFQGRKELLEKIKGCIVDSGGAPELDPKLWAAGFTKASLNKQTSAVDFPGEVQNGAVIVNTEEKGPSYLEVALLTMFEMFFKFFLQIPVIRKRLIRVIWTLSKNQPFYPQLYLYSTADKVIPFQNIESFAKHQKNLGQKVTKFNFVASPHVDHYRTFPDKYRSLVQKFIKDCFAAESKELYSLTQCIDSQRMAS